MMMLTKFLGVTNKAMPKLVNKVVFVNGRRTSMRMCQREWSAFEEVCGREKYPEMSCWV